MKLNHLLILMAVLMFAACDKDHSRMDDQEIQDYLDSHNITAKEHSSGIYYVIHEEGEGKHPLYYSTVIIKYKGYFTNDEVFDETEDDNELESRVDKFVEGFQTGLQLMRPGGKATFYIPSHLAYGKDGSGAIPGWSVVIFDVELVGFKE